MIKKNNIDKNLIEELKNIDNFLFFVAKNCNYNIIDKLKNNPILLKAIKRELKDIVLFLNTIDMSKTKISLDNIFNYKYTNKLEEFIIKNNIANWDYKDYKNLLKTEELDLIYPRNNRIERKKELELKIKQELQFCARMKDINEDIAKSKEKKIEEYKEELKSIEDSLNVQSRKDLEDIICYKANTKLLDLKNRAEKFLNIVENLNREQ